MVKDMRGRIERNVNNVIIETEEERRRRLDVEETLRENPNADEWDLFLVSIGMSDGRR